MAIPQWAMAQPGSFAATSWKAWMAAEYQKEWSRATARSKSFSTAGLQEVGKCTVPRRSGGAPAWAWSC